MAQTIVRQLVSVVKTSIWEVALPHEASETFDGIGRLNVSVQSGRKVVKRQQVLFILSQAAHRFPDSAGDTWLEKP